ncbi:MAG: amino acid ABC transporter permease [Lachnospiraceae bacterium]|nr:amino acid ABC transporter permease [Lachnospiraceae bacterium]
MSTGNFSIRDALYESPGPKAKRRIAATTAASCALLVWLLFVVLRRFYMTGQLGSKYWSFFTKYATWRFILRGLSGTLQVALASGVITFLAGLLLMLGRIGKNRIIRGVSIVLIEFSRGVPTLLFIYFFLLIAPQFGVKLPAFWKIAMPVAISAAGVVAETLRSGVNAVPKGQTEAALSLGMRESHVFFKIVFPQALRYVIPALISELVIVLKDTTFAYVVNYADLMQNARVLISNHDALLSVYLVTALIYILINFILNKISVALAGRRDISKSTIRYNPEGADL